MKKIKKDVAVIGAGTAGLTARHKAEKSGAEALLIGSAPLGTTCARVGCMPSKLLIAAAEAAFHASQTSRFGIQTTVRIKGRQVMARVRRERDRFVDSVMPSFHALHKGKNFIQGTARFLDAHTVQVGNTRVEAKTFIIATGMASFIPPPYRNLGKILLTNENVFELKDLPKSLLVVGTGLIGLELGQAFHRLGVRVTFLGQKQVAGPLADPAVHREALRLFSSEMDFHPVHTLEEVKKLGSGARVTFRDGKGKRRSSLFQRVLIAAGRRPLIEKLDLGKTGILGSENSLPACDPETMQVGDSHFFMAGDVNNDRPLLHEAAEEGKIAGENAALFPDIRRKKRWVRLEIVFTDPQIAIVGKGWKELDCAQIRIGEIDYAKQGRAQVMGINQGKVRIYGDPKTERILGAEMLGPRVEHTAHWLALAIQKEMTVSQLLDTPVYHPVIEEGIDTALRDLLAELKADRPRVPPCEETGPGV